MFNSEILSKVYELREKLKDSNEYRLVKEKEKIMEEECSMLLIKYNNAFNEYNEALRFKDYGSDIESKQRILNEIKIELDNNKYIKDYKAAYKDITKLLKGIEAEIFKGIIENKNILI